MKEIKTSKWYKKAQAGFFEGEIVDRPSEQGYNRRGINTLLCGRKRRHSEQRYNRRGINTFLKDVEEDPESYDQTSNTFREKEIPYGLSERDIIPHIIEGWKKKLNRAIMVDADFSVIAKSGKKIKKARRGENVPDWYHSYPNPYEDSDGTDESSYNGPNYGYFYPEDDKENGEIMVKIILNTLKEYGYDISPEDSVSEMEYTFNSKFDIDIVRNGPDDTDYYGPTKRDDVEVWNIHIEALSLNSGIKINDKNILEKIKGALGELLETNAKDNVLINFEENYTDYL